MAMNEVLCAPYAFTIASSSGVTAPENMSSERLGRVATTASTGAPFVVLDLGSAKRVGLIMVIATSVSAGNASFDCNVMTTADSGGSGSVFYSGPRSTFASAEAAKRLHRQFSPVYPGNLVVTAMPTGRYVRVSLPLNVTIGRIVVGDPFIASDTMDIGYSFTVVDLGENRRSATMLENQTIRGKVLKYSWVWSWMSEAEARGTLLDLLAYAGTTRDLICILNPDAPDLHNVIGYGRLIEEVEGVNVAGGNVDSAYEAKFSLQSRLILNL